MNGMVARDKMFAIFDEPTSDLDSLNEAVILKVLRDEGAGRTVAVVWVCRFFDIFLIIINKISQNYSINSCIIKSYNYGGRKCR